MGGHPCLPPLPARALRQLSVSVCLNDALRVSALGAVLVKADWMFFNNVSEYNVAAFFMVHRRRPRCLLIPASPHLQAVICALYIASVLPTFFGVLTGEVSLSMLERFGRSFGAVALRESLLLC